MDRERVNFQASHRLATIKTHAVPRIVVDMPTFTKFPMAAVITIQGRCYLVHGGSEERSSSRQFGTIESSRLRWQISIGVPHLEHLHPFPAGFHHPIPDFFNALKKFLKLKSETSVKAYFK